MRRATLWLAAVTVTACGARTPLEVSTTATAADAGVGVSDAALPSIHGKYVVRYFPDSGEVDAPKDLSHAIVEVLSTDAVLRGAGFADGTFTVSGVAPGVFTLRIDDVVFVGVGDGVVLSDYAAGRPDVDRSPQWSTVDARLTLDGMMPLQPTTDPWLGFFQVVSSNAACFFNSLPQVWTPMPPVGATSVRGARGSFDSGGSPCRIDATRGDHATLLQYLPASARDPSPQGFRIAKLDLPGWSGPDASPSTIMGTLTEVPRTSPFKADLRPGSFSDSLFVPGATGARIRFNLYERPSTSAHAIGPTLVNYPRVDQPPLVDGILALTFADPFPTWTKVVQLIAEESVPVAVPGTGVPILTPFGMTRTLDFTSATTAPIAVAMSPPQDIRVGGGAPFGATLGVGTTPTIRWSPPKYRPTGDIRYSVSVGETNAPQTGASGVTLWTMATSVVVPSGFLLAGKVYVASVVAEWTGVPIDFPQRPLDGDVLEQTYAPSGGFSP